MISQCPESHWVYNEKCLYVGSEKLKYNYWCPPATDIEGNAVVSKFKFITSYLLFSLFLDYKSTGWCPSKIESPVSCSINYKLIGTKCVRVSVIKLTWGEAEQKCKSEGGHLLSITNAKLQLNVKRLINDKVAPYAPHAENFWLGGTVRHVNEWKWISTLENMTAYNNWKDDKEGSGCVPPGFCLDSQRVLMKGPKYEWSADDQAKEYPYICESGCAVGYIWQKTAKKCVKIVRTCKEKRSHSQASLFCAKENARLLTLSSCEEFKGLVKDLKFFCRQVQSSIG